jgi:hypothetical protein
MVLFPRENPARRRKKPVSRRLRRRKRDRPAASTFRPGRRDQLLDEFRADFGCQGEPVRALKAAQSAPGGAVFDAVGLDRISELREGDLRGAHQMRSVIDRLAAQESADRVGRMRGGAVRTRGRPERGRRLRRRGLYRARSGRRGRRCGRSRIRDVRRRGRKRGDRRRGHMRSDRLSRHDRTASRLDERRRRMPPDLQQKRAAADSRDESGQGCADVDSPGRRGHPLHQQTRRPATCRRQQKCKVASACETARQPSFPKGSIRERPR